MEDVSDQTNTERIRIRSGNQIQTLNQEDTKTRRKTGSSKLGWAVSRSLKLGSMGPVVHLFMFFVSLLSKQLPNSGLLRMLDTEAKNIPVTFQAPLLAPIIALIKWSILGLFKVEFLQWLTLRFIYLTFFWEEDSTFFKLFLFSFLLQS